MKATIERVITWPDGQTHTGSRPTVRPPVRPPARSSVWSTEPTVGNPYKVTEDPIRERDAGVKPIRDFDCDISHPSFFFSFSSTPHSPFCSVLLACYQRLLLLLLMLMLVVGEEARSGLRGVESSADFASHWLI